MHFLNYFVLVLFFIPLAVWPSLDNQQSLYFNLQVTEPVKSLNHLKFDINSYQYVVSNSSSAKQENTVKMAYAFNKATPSSRSKIDLALYAQSGLSSQLDIAAPEIFYKLIRTNHSFGLGRQYTKPSAADRTFNLGLVHPYFTQDYLQFTHQGLTGFEYEFTNNKYSFLAGYYPLYLPNQEPLVKIEDGDAMSQNRWSKTPPEKFIFNNQTKDIHYTLNSYDTQEILNNPTFRLAGGIQLGEAQTSQIQWGYKYGPLPQIIIDRQTYADLDATGNVNFTPAVNYSKTFHLDYTLSLNKKWRLQLSSLYDKPEQEKAKPGRSLQMFSPMDVQSIKLAYQMKSNADLNQSVYLAYGLVNGGEIKDLNFDGSENIFTFTKFRQQYFKSLKIGAELSYYAFLAKPQISQIEWLYDQVQKGSVLSFQQKFEIITSMNLKLGMDILGVESGVLQNDDHFINKYKSNDRFYSGLSYVY